MRTALHVTAPAARRFLRHMLALDAPHADIPTALAHHGFIQIDPINTCGRMHDLILRNRLRGYREGMLHDCIHSPARPGFEHYLPGQGILVAFPLAAWPYLTGHMMHRGRLRNTHYGKLTQRESVLADRILAKLASRGPLTSDEIEHDGWVSTAWGTRGRLVKRVFEKLFDHGRILITARRNFRRVYDLPERVLPAAVLAEKPRPERDVAAWTTFTKLRQRRLVRLKRDDLLLVADLIQPVVIEGADCPLLYCLREDAAVLSAFEARPSKIDDFAEPLLLAPLDPLIYDRRITAALWNFDYTWEVYTPPHKRVRGYYALPILAGIEMVGHVDLKADRKDRRLRLVSRLARRGYRVAPAVKSLASFLSLRV